MKFFSIHTLGCKVNQYDGQLLREQFLSAGYTEWRNPFTPVPADEIQEDVFILNTCTVTQEADKECQRIVRKARRIRPKARLVLTGCAVSAPDQELLKNPDVDLFVANNRKEELLDLYAAAMGKDINGNTPSPFPLPQEGERVRGEGAAADRTRPRGIVSFRGHCRAFVKIQDGCNEFCSFCKIPYVRGRNRSRLAAEIRREVEVLAANGYREIILTGVHAGNYGIDNQKFEDTIPISKSKLGHVPEFPLADLVAQIHDIEGVRRIRFSSIEPMNLSDDLIVRLSDFPKVCPHFHLPLQSGDDEVLRAMRRRYTVEKYRHVMEVLRRHFTDVEITTDIIVGFHGETDAHFENTLRFVQEMEFLKVHVFPYSARPGTLATKFPNPVPPEAIRRRADRLIQKAEEGSMRRRKMYIGRTMRVLVEGQEESPGFYAGFTPNYLRVLVPGDPRIANSFQDVLLTGLCPDGLIGELLSLCISDRGVPVGY